MSAKLTEEQVKEIRQRASTGEEYRELTKDYAVSKATISNIVTRKTWTNT